MTIEKAITAVYYMPKQHATASWLPCGADTYMKASKLWFQINYNFLKKLDTHILPQRLPDLTKKYGYPGWISVQQDGNGNAKMAIDGKPFRDITCNCWQPEERIKEADLTDVQVQVLSTVPVLFNYWAQPEHTLDLAKYLNDNIAQTCSLHPTRFIGLGTLPMQNAELSVQELKRCKNELGLAGIQIGSHINEWNLDAPELDPIWTACEELDMSVFVHPWDMESKGRMSNYWFPWLIGMPCETTIAVCSLMLGGVLERHPKLKVCLAHGGGSFPYTMGRIEHGYQVRPDLVATKCGKSPMHYLERIWTDSLVHDEDALLYLMKKFTADRIMLGSDYPFPLGEHHAGKMIEDSKLISEEDKAKMLGLNVMRFFNLKKEDFQQPAAVAKNGDIILEENINNSIKIIEGCAEKVHTLKIE
ncbi:hypothetical protein HDU92_006244 [Lobulomyces angularis]|nr:hypothetical protein HDU92_006244 [Lobulomyces angularis]